MASKDTTSTKCEVPPWSPSPSATSRTSRSSSLFSSPLPSKPNPFAVSVVTTPTNKNNGGATSTFSPLSAVVATPTQSSPAKQHQQQQKPVITPNKLKMDTVADSGAVPLWFQYTLPSNSAHNKKKKKAEEEETTGSSIWPGDDNDESPKKLYRHSLSGERRGQSLRGGNSNRNDCVVPTSRKTPPLPPSSSRTTPHIAAAFLSKVEKSLESDLRQCAKAVPSMKVIHSVKGRWPPKPQQEAVVFPVSETESSESDSSDSSAGKPSQASHLKPHSPATKEIIQKFESTTSASVVVPTQQPLVSSSDVVVVEDEDVEDVETTELQKKPLEESSLPPLPPTATTSSSTACKTDRQQPNAASFNNSSKLSSSIRTQNLLRSSYKIQYVRGKSEDPRPSYNDGGGLDVVDSSTSNAATMGQNRRRPEGDHRFDVSHGGKDAAPHCYYSTGHDHRFDPMDTSDTTVPPRRPGHDKDEEEEEDHEYIPTIWQTRMKSDGSAKTNASKQRKRWRLKRVWESSRDNTIVISNNHEPEYIVEEKDLENALRTLLGVVSYDSSSSSTVSDLSSPGEEGQHGRQWKDHNRDIAPIPKGRRCFRVQRIWDDGEHVVKTEDGKSCNGPALLQSFENENSESFVWDYASRQLVPSSDQCVTDDGEIEQSKISSVTDFLDSNRSEWSMPLNGDSTDGPFHTRGTARGTAFDQETGSLYSSESLQEEERGDLSVCSEDASFVDGDVLDDEEFIASLGSLDNEGLDDDNTESYTGLHLVEREPKLHSVDSDEPSSSLHSAEIGKEGKLNQVKVLRKQLREVEHAIENIRHNHDMTRDETKTVYKELRSQCMKYLDELTHHLSEFEEVDSHTSSADSQVSLVHGLDEEEENDGDDDESVNSRISKTQGRDPQLVKRKLHKTERLIARMIEKHGEMARTRALYIKLHEKRAKYLQELGLNYQPLDFAPCRYQADEDDLTDVSENASMTSLLDNTLDVIEEGDDDRSCEGSACSAVDESRSRQLLQRKRRKVERKMLEILAERGPKARTRSKLFRRYEAKLFQYCYELGESPKRFHDGEEHQISSSSLLPIDKSSCKLRKGVANAIDVMDSSNSSTLDDNDHKEDAHRQGHASEQTDFSRQKGNIDAEDVFAEKTLSPKPQSRFPGEIKRMRWSPSSATQRVVPSLPKTLALSCDST